MVRLASHPRSGYPLPCTSRPPPGLCSPARNAVERLYVAALGNVTTWAKDGDELVLSNASGGELLRFRVATLVGAWKVTGLYGNNAISSAIAGTELTATFGDDGKLAGSGGCNGYSSTYDAEEGTISIDAVAATKKLCMEPVGVMEQESAFFAALGDATKYNLNGEMAELLNDSAQKLVTLVRAASAGQQP